MTGIEIEIASVTIDQSMQPRCEHKPETVAQYAEHLRDGAIFPPIVVFRLGKTLLLSSGFHRIQAHLAVGRTTIMADIREGDRKAAVRHALGDNELHGRNITLKDRQNAYTIGIAEGIFTADDTKAVTAILHCTARWAQMLTAKARGDAKGEREAQIELHHDEGMSCRKIAKKLGIGLTVVSRHVESVGVANTKPSYLQHPYLSGGFDDTQEEPNHIGDEWYTPERVVVAVRKVMGGEIDLDPASSAVANEVVKALRFFTKEDNGLALVWTADSLFMNPPYSMPLIEQFVDKFLQEYSTGNIRQAIVLTNNSADTGWYRKLAAGALVFCITNGRISFYSPERGSDSPRMGQVFFYFGGSAIGFVNAFREFGEMDYRIKHHESVDHIRNADQPTKERCDE